MGNKTSIERLSELTESEEYREDFRELKKRVLSKGKRKQRDFIRCHFQKDWGGDLDKAIQKVSPHQLRDVLNAGNINEWWILIPTPYSYFKDKWDIEYFFDPMNGFGDDFQPFKRKHPVIPCYSPMSEEKFVILPESQFDPYKLHIEIDVTFPMGTILREVRKEIKEWKDDLSLKIKSTRGRPRTWYSQLRLMKKIWEERCKGHRLGAYEESRIIYEALKEVRADCPWPITINRHYLPMLKKETKNK